MCPHQTRFLSWKTLQLPPKDPKKYRFINSYTSALLRVAANGNRHKGLFERSAVTDNTKIKLQVKARPNHRGVLFRVPRRRRGEAMNKHVPPYTWYRVYRRDAIEQSIDQAGVLSYFLTRSTEWPSKSTVRARAVEQQKTPEDVPTTTWRAASSLHS